MLLRIPKIVLYRIVTAGVFILTTTVFVVTFSKENEAYNPDAVIGFLKDHDSIRFLRDLSAELEICFNECKKVDFGKIKLPLSNDEIERLEKVIPARENVKKIATLKYSFDMSELKWMEKQHAIALVIPECAAINASVKGSDQGEKFRFGQSMVNRVPISELQKTGMVEIKMDFSSLNWFGPTTYSPALIAEEYAEQYSKIHIKRAVVGSFARQIILVISLLLSGIALILDHNRALRFLAFFASMKAVRTAMPIFIRSESDITALVRIGIGFVNALLLWTACGFLFSLLIKSENMKRRLSILVMSVCLGLVCYAVINEYSYFYVDSITDLSIGIFGIVIIIGHLIFERNKNNAGANSDLPLFLPNSLWKISRIMLLLGGYSASSYVNLSDLLSVIQGQQKSVLELKSALLFPIMIIVAFIDIGPITRQIDFIKKQIAMKFRLDDELKAAAKLQEMNLPKKKGQYLAFSWRVLHSPISKLSGDWFGIKTIRILQEEFFVAAVVDCTGHGVSAALATSVVASAFGIWCEEINGTESTSVPIEKHLANLFRSMDMALCTSGTSATAAILIITATGRRMFYGTAGHPPLVVLKNGAFELLQSDNSILGLETNAFAKVDIGSYELDGVEHVAAFTDGISPNIQQMFAKLARKSTARANLLSEIIRTFRSTRFSSRDPSLGADDMTLLIVNL